MKPDSSRRFHTASRLTIAVLMGAALALVAGCGGESEERRGALRDSTRQARPLSTEERHALALINRFRVENGRPKLRRNNVLRSQAKRWAAEMSQRQQYSHDGFPERVRGWRRSGEVVGMTLPTSANSIVEFWIGSPPHRKVLLGRFRLIGIGEQGGYWCADLVAQ